MAGSINRATILGNVGKDPEIRTMNSGDRVANFSIATSESWKDKSSGEKKERTQWHNIVAYGAVVEVIEKWVRKGDKVLVEGSIETRKWQDQSGNDKYTTEIVMRGFDSKLVLLGSKNGGDGGGVNRDGSGGGNQSRHTRDDSYGGDSYGGGGDSYGGQDARGNPRETFSADLDDEIPFISMGYIW